MDFFHDFFGSSSTENVTKLVIMEKNLFLQKMLRYDMIFYPTYFYLNALKFIQTSHFQYHLAAFH